MAPSGLQSGSKRSRAASGSRMDGGGGVQLTDTNNAANQWLVISNGKKLTYASYNDRCPTSL